MLRCRGPYLAYRGYSGADGAVLNRLLDERVEFINSLPPDQIVSVRDRISGVKVFLTVAEIIKTLDD